MNPSRNYYVVLTPPCTNANLHMGHLTGVYIPGDIYARYLQKQGHMVTVVMGVDQNNTYTQDKADQMKWSLEKTQNYFSEEIRKTLQKADVHYDLFVETKSKEHVNMAQEIAALLQKNNALRVQPIKQLYCLVCEIFCFDSRVRGYCGHCNAFSDAGICENCHSILGNHQLLEASHEFCSTPCIQKETSALCLDIAKIKKTLSLAIKNSAWDERLKLKYLEYLSYVDQLDPLLTYTYEKGIPVVDADISARYLVIWFEAVWSLLTAIATHKKLDLAGVIEHLNQSENGIVPFLGQDTEYCYTLGFSSVLMAMGVKIIPKQFSIQRFVLWDQKKFSSRRNHFLTLDDVLEQYPLYVIRYYCFSVLKPYLDNANHFCLQAMQDLSTRIKRLLSFVIYRDSYPDTVEPAVESSWLSDLMERYHRGMQSLQFSEAFAAMSVLEDHLLQSEIPEKKLIDAWILMVEPIMPQTIVHAVSQKDKVIFLKMARDVKQ